jgi:Fur family transcriptional regulator, zinc uptake regulator
MTRRTGHGHEQDHDHDHAPAAGRLTPGRRAVLDVLERERRPIGAYEMIDLIGAAGARRPAPTQVYRALDFLVEQGLVHRLASRNAFLACGHGHAATEPVAFLICDDCGHVDEATSSALTADVVKVASLRGFEPRAQIIEIAGRCAACTTKDAA